MEEGSHHAVSSAYAIELINPDNETVIRRTDGQADGRTAAVVLNEFNEFVTASRDFI